MRRRVEQAWKLRWLAIMSCAARAVASSLLELRGHGGADGVVPLSHEVEAAFRHAHHEEVCVTRPECFLLPGVTRGWITWQCLLGSLQQKSNKT